MIPYKFINIDKFLQDINSDNPEFDIIRKAYHDFVFVIMNRVLYISYLDIGTRCQVDPTDYIILQENGRLAVVEESDIES